MIYLTEGVSEDFMVSGLIEHPQKTQLYAIIFGFN